MTNIQEQDCRHPVVSCGYNFVLITSLGQSRHRFHYKLHSWFFLLQLTNLSTTWLVSKQVYILLPGIGGISELRSVTSTCPYCENYTLLHQSTANVYIQKANHMTVYLDIRIITVGICLCILTLLTGCQTNTAMIPAGSVNGSKTMLRVGISTNAPPLVFAKGNELQGLEIDFARQLGDFLGRKPYFVRLDWSKQLTALEEGKIDIIMSGMTITPKRAYRVAFAKPYMRSGQMLLVRMKEAQRYSSGIYSLMGAKPAIGIVKDTTGDFFITKTINRPNLTRFKTSESAVRALISGEIDVFVHDAPIVCYFAAMHESARLTPILQLATEEYLAWAVNKSDTALLADINRFIDASLQNKSLQTTIKRWIPYL